MQWSNEARCASHADGGPCSCASESTRLPAAPLHADVRHRPGAGRPAIAQSSALGTGPALSASFPGPWPRSLGHGTISQTRRLAKGRSRGACRCWVLWERCRGACSSERRPRVPGMLTPASPGHDLSHVLPWLRGRAARTRGQRFRCGPPRPGGAGAQHPGRRATRAPRGPRLLTAFCRRREVERDMPWSESRRAVWPPVSHVHTHARTLVYTHAHDTRRHRCVQVHASLPDFSKLRRPPLSSSVKNARYRSHQDLSPSSLKSRACCCRRQDSVLFSWPSSILSFTCPTSLSGRLWVGT